MQAGSETNRNYILLHSSPHHTKYMDYKIFTKHEPPPTNSFINWIPDIKPSKNLARLLAPLMGKSESSMKNFAEFERGIRETQMDDETTMSSFDVVSLFTKAPLQESMIHISDMLHADKALQELTSILPDVICSLNKTGLTISFLIFKDEFYEQAEGAAMSSVLSTVVAHTYMEKFEEDALSSADFEAQVVVQICL